MMINRDQKNATVYTYASTVDAYGQKRQSTPTSRSIAVTGLQIYQHQNVEDIRFNEVEYTCLTKDKSISDENELNIDNKTYLIKFVNKQGRLSQLFLTEKR